MSALASAWIAQDKAVARKLLDTWAQRTGFVVPRFGLLFVEPEKSTIGPGICWAAVMLSTTVTGTGTALRGDAPEREIFIDCLLYCQPGSVPPAGWEAALVGDFETAVAWAADQPEGYSPYYVMHPTPIPPTPVGSPMMWAVEGIQFRLKVG